MGCGIVLACGLIIILVLITAPFTSRFPLSIQKNIPYLIFIFSLLVFVPIVSRRLNMLGDITRILGWTFVGIGAEFITFPVPLLFLVLKFPSVDAIFIGGMILTYSVVFGIPAGLISITIGIWLIRKKGA